MASVTGIKTVYRLSWYSLGGALTLSCTVTNVPAIAQTSPESMTFPTETLPPESLPTSNDITAPTETPFEQAPLADNFPASLIGQNVGTVVDSLRAEGWTVIAQSPSLVQLDKGAIGLDLGVEPFNGEIVEAEVIDLF